MLTQLVRLAFAYQCSYWLEHSKQTMRTIRRIQSAWPQHRPQLTQTGDAIGSALAAATDIHRQVPTYIADIRRDWLTNQNTDWCFVVIGLVGRQSHSPLLQLKIDPVCQMGQPYWLALSRCQRIFINIRGQYSIQKNIYIHRWVPQTCWNNLTSSY